MRPKCAAMTKQSHRPCKLPAGYKTDHVGQGRCHLHGGRSPIKTGRYSTVKRKNITDLMEQLAKEPNPTDMLPEVLLLRAYVHALVDRKKAAVEDSTINTLSSLVDKIGRMIERIQKAELEGSISMQAVVKLQEQMAIVVTRHVTSEIAAKIEEDWKVIWVDTR